MTQEFKWIIYLSIEAKNFKAAERAMALAQDAFFDALNDNDKIEWQTIDEELK